MPKLYIMVGIPGSGKSTFAKELNGIICSSDEIRKELYGSEEILGSNYKVFKALDEKVAITLSSDQNVIYDATNLRKNGRKKIINKFREYVEEIIIIYMNTPFDIALKRNNKRKRKVPENVISNMYYDSLEEPENYKADKIFYIYSEEY